MEPVRTLIASSANPTGQSEALTIYLTDDCFGTNDGFDYNIEVRYVAGSACGSWTLTVDKSSC